VGGWVGISRSEIRQPPVDYGYLPSSTNMVFIRPYKGKPIIIKGEGVFFHTVDGELW